MRAHELAKLAAGGALAKFPTSRKTERCRRIVDFSAGAGDPRATMKKPKPGVRRKRSFRDEDKVLKA